MILYTVLYNPLLYNGHERQHYSANTGNKKAELDTEKVTHWDTTTHMMKKLQLSNICKKTLSLWVLHLHTWNVDQEKAKNKKLTWIQRLTSPRQLHAQVVGGCGKCSSLCCTGGAKAHRVGSTGKNIKQKTGTNNSSCQWPLNLITCI